MDVAGLLDIAALLGETLLHFLWQGVLIAIAYALLRAFVHSELGRHHIALGGLIAALAAPALTFRWLWMDTANIANTTTSATGAAASAFGYGPVLEAVSHSAIDWTALLTVVWLVGALLIFCRLLHDWLALRRVIRNSLPAPADLVAMLERQVECFGLRRRVRIRLSASYGTPGVYGLFKPVILMPVALMLKLPRDQIEALIIHELAHVRRMDALGNVIAITARTLLYFHPVVHWLSRDLERYRERLCDDLVLERQVDRVKYARALSSVAMVHNSTPAALLTANGGELTLRVQHILAIEEPETGHRNSLVPVLFAATTIIVSLIGLRGFAPDATLTARPEFRVVAQLLAPALMLSERSTATAPNTLPQLTLAVPVPEIEATVATPAVEQQIPLTVVPPDALPVSDITTAPLLTDSAPSILTPAPAMAPAISDTIAEPIAETALTALEHPTPTATTHPESTAIVDSSPELAVAAPVSDAPQAPAAKHTVHPTYPRQATLQGLEGVVTLSFQIGSDGRPVDIDVIDSQAKQRVLETAAMSALRKWRFSSADTSGTRYQQTFDFSLGNGTIDDGACSRKTGSRICR